MNHACIADAVRTPRGRGNNKGSLKGIKPALLPAQVLRGLARRTALDTSQVNDATHRLYLHLWRRRSGERHGA